MVITTPLQNTGSDSNGAAPNRFANACAVARLITLPDNSPQPIRLAVAKLLRKKNPISARIDALRQNQRGNIARRNTRRLRRLPRNDRNTAATANANASENIENVE